MGEGIIIQISKEELKAMIQAAVSETIKRTQLPLKQPTPDIDPLVKIGAVCALLNVSKVTIHKWKKDGRIPFHRISNRIFFRKSEILESLKKVDLREFNSKLR